MADPTYQEAHLGFVSNNSGTTYHEVQLLIIIPQLSLLVGVLHYFWPAGTKWQRVFDFVFIVIPQLAIVTFANEQSCLVGAVLYLVCAAFSLVVGHKVQKLDGLSTQTALRQMEKCKNYLNVFRGSILVLTVMCILAVDFPAFPRRFAKTEVYGFGLMDAGIGLFFISNGIVSHEARGIQLNIKTKLKHLVTSCVPLLILGFGRLLLVTISGYHNPISEYGVHWNFFLSLAVMKISSTLLFAVVSPKCSLFLAIVLALAYQFLLSNGGLTEFILEDSSAENVGGLYRYFYDNRSGILSCIGSLSIYFIAVYIGRFIFLRKRETFRQSLIAIGQLYGAWIILTAATGFSNSHVQPASRKLCNLTFVLWSSALTAHTLAILMAGDLIVSLTPRAFHSTSTIKEPEKDPLTVIDWCERKSLFQCVNKDGLFYFLAGNIATGVVNLSMKTIYASPAVTFVTMISYLAFTFLLVIKKQSYQDVKSKRG